MNRPVEDDHQLQHQRRSSHDGYVPGYNGTDHFVSGHSAKTDQKSQRQRKQQGYKKDLNRDQHSSCQLLKHYTKTHFFPPGSEYQSHLSD